MNSQHLSDEAIAAHADGVLGGHARERASRHTSACPECAYAVAVQREAIWALRAAPAPALPAGLFDRLCAVPVTTPINVVPSTIATDGSAMFAAFGTMTSAALVPSTHGEPRQHRVRPMVLTAAAVVAVGIFAVSSTGQAGSQNGKPIRSGPGTVVPAGFVQPSGTGLTGDPGR